MKKNCHRNPHYVDKAVGSLAMSKYFSDELLSQYLPSLNILCCRNLILGIYFQVSKDLAKRKLNFFFLQIFIHSRVSSGWIGSFEPKPPFPLLGPAINLFCSTLRCLGLCGLTMCRAHELGFDDSTSIIF